MNLPSTQPTPAAPTAPAPQTAPTPTTTTLEERASAALAELYAEDASDRAGSKTTPQPAPGSEAATGSPPPSEAATSGTDSGAAKTPEQIAQERRERLAQLHAKNRSRVDEKHRQAEGDKAARELERARQELADAQSKLSKLVDPSQLDEAKLLQLAEQSQVSPKKLAEWMRARIENPELVAERTAADAAKRAVDPELAAVRAELAKATDQIQAFTQAQEQAAAYAAEQQALSEFCSLVTEQAATAPLAASFLQQHGQDEFYRIAIAAAEQVPGADWPTILDQVEENLSSLASLFGARAPAPSQGTAPPSSPAAAQATTVSNALAATRTAVLADEDLSKLSLDERARRLIESDDW